MLFFPIAVSDLPVPPPPTAIVVTITKTVGNPFELPVAIIPPTVVERQTVVAFDGTKGFIGRTSPETSFVDPDGMAELCGIKPWLCDDSYAEH